MKVRDLIRELLEMEMDSEVIVKQNSNADVSHECPECGWEYDEDVNLGEATIERIALKPIYNTVILEVDFYG